MSIVKITVRNGNELFEPIVYGPRKNRKTREIVHSIFNLKFKPRDIPGNDFAGGGIYSIRYRGQHLYPGIYTGEKIPFSNNVVKQRLQKHIESLTMRGYRVGFELYNYKKIMQMRRNPVVDAILSNGAQCENGSVKSYPCKVAFAAANWDAMSQIEKDPTVLTDFEFIYARIGSEEYSDKITHAQLKAYLETIERGLILNTNPLCNERRVKPKLEHLQYGPDRHVWDEFEDMLISGNWKTKI